jgi:hypothetical protein
MPNEGSESALLPPLRRLVMLRSLSCLLRLVEMFGLHVVPFLLFRTAKDKWVGRFLFLSVSLLFVSLDLSSLFPSASVVLRSSFVSAFFCLLHIRTLLVSLTLVYLPLSPTLCAEHPPRCRIFGKLNVLRRLLSRGDIDVERKAKVSLLLIFVSSLYSDGEELSLFLKVVVCSASPSSTSHR